MPSGAIRRNHDPGPVWSVWKQGIKKSFGGIRRHHREYYNQFSSVYLLLLRLLPGRYSMYMVSFRGDGL